MSHRSPMTLRALFSATLALATLAAAPAGARAAAYVPGEVIVQYERGSSRSEQADVQRDAGVGHGERLLSGARKLEVLDGESVAETLAELRRDPDVAYAAPNYIARVSGYFPNDPGFGGSGNWRRVQWNFVGRNGVNAPDAWQRAAASGAPGGRGVTIAVVDTGLAYRNTRRFRRAPDFNPTRVVPGYDFISNDRFPDDQNGHGTHVAGTLAQWTNNRSGLTGLAYGANLMPIRSMDAKGAGDSATISNGIRYAVRNGARVINMSLEFDASVRPSMVPEVGAALRYAYDRGVVVTAVAGNDGPRVAYPASSQFVIAVGATTESGCIGEYSNGGPALDIVAPGGGPDAAYFDNPRDAARCNPARRGRDIFQQSFSTSVRSFGLEAYYGTSMATPHVTATAALLMASRRLGSRPRPDQVLQRLQETARDLGPDGPDERYGAGLVDAAAALGR